MARKQVNRRTAAAAIRGSVPDAKLKGAKVKVAKVTQGGAPIGGYTQYDRTRKGAVIEIATPVGDDAFSVTVRGHETRHATLHKPARKKSMTQNESIASQIVDDVNNESLGLPMVNPRSLRIYKREHLATALRDLHTVMRNARKVASGQAPDTVAMRNGNLLCGVRVLAMVKQYAEGGIRGGTSKLRSILRLRKAIGDHTVSAISRIVQLAAMRRKRATAISMLTALMEEEHTDMDGIELPPTPADEGILGVPEDGDVMGGKMKVIQLLPRSVYCAKEKRISRKYAPNGVIINATRYVAAIVSGDGNGLFARRIRHKAGGTVVIDASGSMGANRTNLAALCELVPTATVAYYSGRDGRGNGDLCVFANEGKRFAGELPVEHLHGGNAVDLPAVIWMLKHSKPWHLVSDLQFCGGNIGDEAVAHALVERAEKRGDLIVHRSLDAAYEHFGGKGEMPS